MFHRRIEFREGGNCVIMKRVVCLDPEQFVLPGIPSLNSPKEIIVWSSLSFRLSSMEQGQPLLHWCLWENLTSKQLSECQSVTKFIASLVPLRYKECGQGPCSLTGYILEGSLNGRGLCVSASVHPTLTFFLVLLCYFVVFHISLPSWNNLSFIKKK